MEKDFYATIKLKNGEEIFSSVCSSNEDNNILILFSPIIVSVHKSRSGEITYKVEPWLKTTNEDTFIISMDDVLTIIETNDDHMMKIHKNFATSTVNSRKSTPQRKMGYISTVEEAKKLLEKIFNSY